MKATEVLERVVEQLEGIREELIRLTEAIQDTTPIRRTEK